MIVGVDFARDIRLQPQVTGLESDAYPCIINSVPISNILKRILKTAVVVHLSIRASKTGTFQSLPQSVDL